ncbi:beta strand repeat-containing protein, partial [Flavobacterium aciduliphilum]
MNKKVIITLFVLAAFYSVSLKAQVNTNQVPQNAISGENAFIDASTNFNDANSLGKGLVFPRTDLTAWEFKTDALDGIMFPNAFDGMIVYNTATGNTPSGQGDVVAVTPGFYYFFNPDGNFDITTGHWVRIGGADQSHSLVSGAGTPDNNSGTNGDFFIDTTNNVIYGPKAAGVWPPTGTSLVGPAGAQGQPGATGADGQNTYQIWLSQGNSGTISQFLDSLKGVAGTNGATWNSGAGIPSDALGSNGDYYLNTTTNDVYLKTADTYSIITNIKGATGPAGSNATVTGTAPIDVTSGVVSINDSGITTTKLADNSVTSAKILDGTIVDADISDSASISDTKLATISAVGKVANSATTATSTNTPSTIVLRDASGNFSAGSITATNISGNGSGLTNVTASGFSGTLGVSNGGTGTTTSTGTGSVVLSNSPTLVTPNLGTPTTLVGTNITGTAADLSIGGNAATATTAGNVTGTVAIVNGGTGATTSSGALTNLGAQSTSNLSSNVTTDTGSTTKYPSVSAVESYVGTQITSNVTPDATSTIKGKIQLAGDLSGTAASPLVAAGAIDNSKISSIAAIADTKLATISTSGKVANSATTATAVKTPGTIVLRDASGNFSAETITGNLVGNASTATTATNTAVTDDTATAVAVYPTFVTGTTGNLPQKIS